MDKELAEGIALSLRKLRADLHIISTAIKNNDSELLYCATLDLQAGSEVFEMLANTMLSGEPQDPDTVYMRYAEAVAVVDPVLHAQWDWSRDDV